MDDRQTTRRKLDALCLAYEGLNDEHAALVAAVRDVFNALNQDDPEREQDALAALYDALPSDHDSNGLSWPSLPPYRGRSAD
jgi:hypothetical protein